MTVTYDGNDTYILDFHKQKIALHCDEIKVIKSYDFINNKMGESIDDLLERIETLGNEIDRMKESFESIDKIVSSEV